MAKKEKPVTVQAKVTKIPLPISDSALVIDLPDGQKLVVGKMNHGTVIEVATWRGTGRPDSRTNRLMLGMSNTEIESQIQEEEERQAKEKIDSWQIKLMSAKNIVLIWIVKAKNTALSIHSKFRSDKRLVSSENKHSPFKKFKSLTKKEAKNALDDEIQVWLNNVTAMAVTSNNKTASSKKTKSRNQKSTLKQETSQNK